MQEDKLVLLNDKNEQIEIKISNIKGFQRILGTETINSTGFSMPGDSYEYIEVKTKTGEKYNIIRNYENDKQILNAILK